MSALTFLLITLASVAFMTTAPACAQKTCELTGVDFGRGPGEGSLIGPDDWETSAVDGKWLPFPGQRLLWIYPKALSRRRIANVLVYISPVEEPNSRVHAEQYTVASGNVAVITHVVDPDQANPDSVGIGVKNDSCADFFVRVALQAYPVASGDAGPDASLVTDASIDATLDGGVEASTDAASDALSDAAADGGGD